MFISIITINFNNVEGLKRTMTSVFDQLGSNIEYIIIDGGSIDGSKDIIEAHDSNIAFWVSEPDQGIYHAMNKGIRIAKGDYLLFLNSGDTFFSNEALRAYYPYLAVPKPKDILYGNIQVMSPKPFIKTYPNVLDFKYFIKDTLAHPATLINKSCFADFLYDESLKIVADWKFFMLGICKKKFTYQYIDKIIANFYMDGISSTSPDLVKKERKRVLQKEFNLEFSYYKLIQYLKRAIKR